MQIDRDEAVIVSHDHWMSSNAPIYTHIQGLRCIDHAEAGSRMAAGHMRDYSRLPDNRFVQRRTEEDRVHALLAFYNAEEVGHWRRAYKEHERRFNLRILLEPREGYLMRRMNMHGEITNSQSGSLLGLRIHPQQDLVRKLISGRCSWQPESNRYYRE